MENKKINIAELLKDCPKGMELYSPLCGICVFDCLNMGTIICKKQNTQEITFTSEGYYMLPVFDDCECMLFPSKDQRDWNKFHRPFKNGDIVTWKDRGSLVAFIYKERKNIAVVKYHFALYAGSIGSLTNGEISLVENEIVFATEEEKAKLFKELKRKGYHWNAETKTLETLIKPKFKVEDKVRHKKNGKQRIITKIHKDCYECDNRYILLFEEQDDWELVIGKFDTNTLIPFESRVLVRHDKYNKWGGSFFSHIDNDLHSNCYKYVTTAGKSYPMMIPYENNEHLLGSTKDCDNFYKTWEK